MALILRPNVELNYYNTVRGTKNNQENRSRELIYKWVSVAIILERSLTVNIT